MRRRRAAVGALRRALLAAALRQGGQRLREGAAAALGPGDGRRRDGRPGCTGRAGRAHALRPGRQRGTQVAIRFVSSQWEGQLVRSGLERRHQAAARAHRLHLRAARLAREQVQDDALPLRVRAAQPGAQSQSHGDAGEDLVPEPAHQVEEAEPGHGREQSHRPPAALGRRTLPLSLPRRAALLARSPLPFLGAGRLRALLPPPRGEPPPLARRQPGALALVIVGAPGARARARARAHARRAARALRRADRAVGCGRGPSRWALIPGSGEFLSLQCAQNIEACLRVLSSGIWKNVILI